MYVLTPEEAAVQAKGWGKRFESYVDLPGSIFIPLEQYKKIVDWCEPYMKQRCEVQGTVTVHADANIITIERAYVMGGNSVSTPVRCRLDSDDMLRQMQEHYPDRTAFMSDEVGFWHLHPGQYPMLSVGDVEERRIAMRECGQTSEQDRGLELLMYGDGRGYQLSGYLVGLNEVNRLPVRILE